MAQKLLKVYLNYSERFKVQKVGLGTWGLYYKNFTALIRGFSE
jgi:hypothetical protein